MSPALTLSIYCLLIVAMSLLGGWIPMLVRLTHKRMELALSFISGVMFGVALLLLLPHALEARAEQLGANAPENAWPSHGLAHHLVNPVMLWLLGGFLAMFFIERFFCFHHHAAPGEDGDGSAPDGCSHDHGHAHGDHEHAHAHEPAAMSPRAHALRWSGAAIGLTLHSLLDGVAVAASVAAAAHDGDGNAGLLAGLGTFLVVLLHKPFDSITLGTLMAAGRHSRGMRHIVNLLFALLVPIGAGLFMLGLAGGRGEGGSQALILSAALAFAAGTFLCIALSDLLPELQFHQHDRVKLSIALVLGLAVAWGVAAMEQRLHVHDETPAAEHEDHGG